ncbi:Crp/Fnr family transcriptional regulator [Chitinophaga pinensis]|uniref:Crp/Fnr family transcriptional regulator n=1 Tax=Chitinophaga pinensis TaxID=79329 RepID=A0A5C6LX13_9BACT|nr:Crp/Fnr family transcriptional regulator [Chitinophaga pinensis]TWW01148.1 Crp/Fnr family transcriptional regulator [Chitinophaga pinensis]
MNELEVLKQHISKRMSLPEEELNAFVAAFTVKRIKKRQFIIQPEFIARVRTFIIKGAFRSYVVGAEGTDHTIQLAIDDWWISDYSSYIFQKPATMFVVALEDSIVAQIEYEAEQRLKREYHDIETFFRMAAEGLAAYHQRRIIASLTRTAEERYNDFIAAYPGMLEKVPQYAIASYLGVTTQFISKIRNKKAASKS